MHTVRLLKAGIVGGDIYIAPIASDLAIVCRLFVTASAPSQLLITWHLQEEGRTTKLQCIPQALHQRTITSTIPKTVLIPIWHLLPGAKPRINAEQAKELLVVLFLSSEVRHVLVVESGR